MLTLYDFSPRVAFWGPVIGAPVFAFAAVFVVTYNQLRLERGGVVTAAVVTATHPNDHQTVSVTYVVGQRTFESRVIPDEPNRSYEEIGVGDTILVTYLPADPAVSRGGPQPRNTRAESWGAGIFGIAAGLLIGMTNAIRIRRYRKQRQWIARRTPGDGLA